MSGPQAFQALRRRSALSASRSPSKSHTHSHTLHTPVGPAAPLKPLHGGLLGVADTLTRPAADAGPWGRAARALPAFKGSRAREGFGMGEAAVGEERRQHRGGRRGARRGGRGGAGAVTTSAATLTCTSAPVAPGPPGQFPGTAPLLGRGPLTCTLRGPFHLHTWTLAMKTPYWSLLGGASGPSCSRGRPPMRGPGGAPHGRCQPVRGARAGEGGGGGGQWAGEVAGNGRVR